MDSVSLVNKSHYTLNIPYLISRYIREYDISKANINILLYKKYIDIDVYNLLYNMEKMDREVYVGKMIKLYPEVQQILSDGILEMRQNFVKANNILDMDILSIKNDAIYVIDKIAPITKFGNVEFRLSNVYTSYIKLLKYEVYYFNDSINNLETIDIKGINDSKLLLHQNHMISFICEVLSGLESGNLKDLFSYFNIFFNDYINMKLDLGYYREFNPNSKFVTKQIGGRRYAFDSISEEHRNVLDNSYNLQVLRELYRIMINISKGR